MSRTVKQRIVVLSLWGLVFLVAYGAARHYSPLMVTYVVEQALIQKAPEGMDPALVQARFESFLGAASPEAKLKKTMDLSTYLEKVQKLTPEELDRLLAVDGTAAKTGT